MALISNSSFSRAAYRRFVGREKKLIGAEATQLLAALALVLSPWIFGFAAEPIAAWNSWLAGGAVLAFGLLFLADRPHWAGWGALAAGLWIMIAPLVLGYLLAIEAVFAHALLGFVVAVTAMAVLWLTARRVRIEPAAPSAEPGA